MTTVMNTQKENAIKVFYIAVGTPMVTGRKTKDFGTDLFTEASIADLGGASRMVMDFGTQLFMETSLAELEAAGRDLSGSIRESNMVGQLQDGVEHIQEAKVLEQIQEKVDVDQFQEKVEILREQLETTLNNWREQFTPGVSAPRRPRPGRPPRRRRLRRRLLRRRQLPRRRLPKPQPRRPRQRRPLPRQQQRRPQPRSRPVDQ